MNFDETNLFIDAGYSQCAHYNEKACGDAVMFKRIPAEERLIAVLADGLGHGLKANILALMTTTMALRFSEEDRDFVHSAEIIMDALPICKIRKISYATFTIVDTRLGGMTRIVEMGNPPFILLRGGKIEVVEGKQFSSPKYRDRTMTSYNFLARPQDRVIFVSDGVTQAGIGMPSQPMGWSNGASQYALAQVMKNPDISSEELSRRILREAIAHEPDQRPTDDISIGCLYFRAPRKMLIFTGPPYNEERDSECAHIFQEFNGTKVISGGTTAEIISRELDEPLEVELTPGSSRDLPPLSFMKGADLVTEGIFTLTRAARYLENDIHGKKDPAGYLVDLMRKNDIIEFLVGTRINEAHQDPNLPVDLELRRNIIKRLADILREKYTKEVLIQFV